METRPGLPTTGDASGADGVPRSLLERLSSRGLQGSDTFEPSDSPLQNRRRNHLRRRRRYGGERTCLWKHLLLRVFRNFSNGDGSYLVSICESLLPIFFFMFVLDKNRVITDKTKQLLLLREVDRDNLFQFIFCSCPQILDFCLFIEISQI